MFFVGDVAIHLQSGSAINKIYTKAKKKTRVQQNPRLIFLVLRMIKIKRCKRKNQEKN
jgi:hypothetical protein